MDSPVPPILSPITPRLPPRSHHRTASRSPTRERITDDILADLSPSTTLEAFTNPSGKLRASIEAASESERAFGIRATLASKKIQEWVSELSAWSWPTESGSSGFEMPVAKRRKVSNADENVNYIGSLPTEDVLLYEVRVEEIEEDMEDLKVEEIKRQVLDTHFSGNSRPSSSASSVPMPAFLSSYTKMDDFTAIVTATVLQALPNLSRLMRLMDVWSMRLAVLRKVPPLLAALDDAEVALQSGWNAIHHTTEGHDTEDALSRETFGVMRDVLQDKVTSLGQDFDYMLDTLEGRQDTLPDSWLDRMEAIEHDYGEWVVSSDRKIREGEWARMAKARKEAEAAEAARLKAEQEAEEARKIEEERAAEQAKRKAEDHAENERRRLEAEEIAEQARLKSERDVAQARKLQEEETAETARRKAQQDADDARRRQEEPDLEIPRREPEKDAECAELDAELARQQALEAAEAQAAESEAQAALARRKLEQYRLEESLSRQESESPDLPEVSEKTEHFDTQDIPSTLRTAPTAVIVAPLVATVSPVDPSTPCSDLSPRSEKIASFDGVDGSPESQNYFSIPPTSQKEALEAGENGQVDRPKQPAKIEISRAESNATIPHSPLTPSPSGNDIGKPHQTPHQTPREPHTGDQTIKHEGSARISTPRSIPRFGHTFANFVRSSSPSTPTEEPPRASPRLRNTPLMKDTNEDCQDTDHTPTKSSPGLPETQHNDKIFHQKAAGKMTDEEARTMVDSSPNNREAESNPFEAIDHKLLHVDDNKKSKRQSRNDSQVSGYATSEPSPEIQEAEPAAYFRPVVSPIKSPGLSTEHGDPTTPTSRMNERREMELGEEFPTLDDQSFSVAQTNTATELPDESTTLSSSTAGNDKLDADIASEDNQEDSMLSSFSSQNSDIDFSTPVVARRTSLVQINTGIKQISLSRPQSSSSDTPTIVTGYGDNVGTPIIPSSPLGNEVHPFFEADDQSPSAGRIGLRNGKSRDISPPGSPPMRAVRPSVQIPASPTLSTSGPSDVSIMSIDAPIFDNIDVSDTPIATSPTRTSDDQLRQQISSILDSIPTRIRLTSEPNVHQTDTLHPKKTRRSVTPSLRSHSSLSTYSSRAPTPSFLLSPAYSQAKSRPRPSNGAPEIKLYHLSRSTGEAPIKLFVRLVGEHGQRVMVRVGGGWADLGEYLKEYASHHGRRSNIADGDKVEIQDLPARIASGSAIRGGGATGRESPASRPVSALDRPASSLAVRKTRKSVGDSSTADSVRAPSTPLPITNNRSLASDTPPSSGAPRSSSRLSWTEDDSSLGLAGPKSKKVAISERDQEWVESMKEKVRQASAEKERERDRRERGTSFGEMDRVGGTKRLFRKGV